MTRKPTNGRRRKGVEVHAAIIAATRREMMRGNFRPSAQDVVRGNGFSVRSIWQHFSTLEDLHKEAIDEATAHAMVTLLLQVTDEREIALVLALGRLPGSTP